MTTPSVNQVPFLRTSRSYPTDINQLTLEVSKSYIDIANAVNNRTIGIFTVNNPTNTGESWFLTSQRQQSFRLVIPINGTGTYNTALIFNQIPFFTKIYGVFTDGTFWYTLPWVSVTNVNNQINIFLQASGSGNVQVVITGGGGAQQPTISSGNVVLEWLSNT